MNQTGEDAFSPSLLVSTMSVCGGKTGLFIQVRAKQAAGVTLELLDNWAIMSLLATATWALSCVIDVCFVSSGVYRRPGDGPAIAGLFCIVPMVVAAQSVEWMTLDLSIIAIGMLSGVVYLLHIQYYFKALFSINDAVNAEIFNTLSVLLVPMFAFVLLNERLELSNYIAMALAGIGILVLVRFQLSRLTPRTVSFLIAAVVAVSLMMVMQAWVLERTNYATAIWLFSSSAVATVILVFGLSRRRRKRIGSMCQQFGTLFLIVQLLEIFAVLGSQRATELAPSVSLVALIESSVPVFVLVFSGLFALLAKHRVATKSTAVSSAMSLQAMAAPAKLASMFLIVFAIAFGQGFVVG